MEVKEFLKRNLPPGMDPNPQKNLFIFGNISAFIISFFAFIVNYAEARQRLYMYLGGELTLNADATIGHFHSMLELFHGMYFLLIMFILGYIIYNYADYRRGSKSIYTMKRLPSVFERHRRALTVPLLSVAATVALAIAAAFLFFIIYVLATPKICLPHDVWGELWRSL